MEFLKRYKSLMSTGRVGRIRIGRLWVRIRVQIQLKKHNPSPPSQETLSQDAQIVGMPS
jgi:hypothetical protein